MTEFGGSHVSWWVGCERSACFNKPKKKKVMWLLAKYEAMQDMLNTVQLVELGSTDDIAFVEENTYKTWFEMDSLKETNYSK